MTLDDFLSALENLIEDRETNDDEPGVGNFSCEDCRACNHCRFCIGCDTCEDCTYCEECMDSTSCTQCKRCVSSEKVSYCDDSRDCKGSRYLTLCVACTDCVHCLACVGLTGSEFYVLNEKRTRKEYFALLRQVQELMLTRMEAGWRPPGIGLASEIIDAVVANRDPTLSAAPWLVDLREDDQHDQRDFSTGLPGDFLADHLADRAPERDDYRDSFDSARPRPGRGYPYDEDRAKPAPEVDRRPPVQAQARRDDYPRDDYAPEPRHADDVDPRSDAAISDWAREPPEFGSSYVDPGEDDRVQARGERERGERERGRARHRHDYGEDLGRDLSEDINPPDVPRRQEQQPTQPFTRRAERAPPDPVWDSPSPRGSRDPGAYEPDHDAPAQHERPAPRERPVSSPWDDQDAPKHGGNAGRPTPTPTRGSLRQAGRPKRPPESATPREVTGTGSYRTGSAPERSGSEGTHTGATGLRLGRKPKRRRS